MNWKSLQKDDDTVVSHLHPLLSGPIAQTRKRREMDSAAGNSHNAGLWQRLSLVAGGVRAQGSGRWAQVVPVMAVLPLELHIPSAHPLDRTLALSALFQSCLSNLWPKIGANMKFIGTC